MSNAINKIALVLLFSFVANASLAQASELSGCKKDASQIQTPMGIFQRYTCPPPSSQPKWLANWQTKWVLGDTILISGPGDISAKNQNSENTFLVLSDFADPKLACPARMFLIDLTGNKAHVYAFGVKYACNEFHWASWGKKISVIAIKENVKFTYANGKLNPPSKNDKKLLAVPFVNEEIARQLPAEIETPPAFVEELPVK